MSSADVMPANSSETQQFPMPSIAPIPIRVKRDRAWVKVDGALDHGVFSRKRKVCSDAAGTPEVSSHKLRRPEDCVHERVVRMMSLSNFVGSSSTHTKPGDVAKAMSVSTVVESSPAPMKFEDAKTMSVSNVASTAQPNTMKTPPASPNRSMIKCRVTGYPRSRLMIDDCEDMWDTKDEQRWNSWCEKSREERGLIQGYEEGDSDCEWQDFKEKRRLRVRRAARAVKVPRRSRESK